MQRRDRPSVGKATRAEEAQIDQFRTPVHNLLGNQLTSNWTELEAVAAETSRHMQPSDPGDGTKHRLEVRRAIVDAGVTTTEAGVLLAWESIAETTHEQSLIGWRG